MMFGNFSGMNVPIYGFHFLVMLAFVVGFSFLIVWAAKTLKSKQLRNIGIGLIVVAVIGWFLGFSWVGSRWWHHSNFSGHEFNAEDCLKNDECYQRTWNMMNEMFEKRTGK